MHEPTVSVVIPSHRGGDYLREAVDSIREQDTSWEIILVADGLAEDVSTLYSFDSRIKVIRQRQRGISIARNVGVSHARADLITFLDDDDRMAPGRLAAQIDVMKDESILLCHTRCRLIDQHGIAVKDGPLRDFQYVDLLRIEGTPLMSSVMVRTSVFHEIGGFNPLLGMAEDMDFLFKVASQGALHFLPEMLTDYRIHPHNTYNSAADSVRTLKAILTQHQIAAEARHDEVVVKATKQGARHILPAASQFDLEEAGDAASKRRYGRSLTLMARAFLRSPVATAWVTSQRIQRGSRT
jgi:glycosyltransferase involved in cell wall biosynthesis